MLLWITILVFVIMLLGAPVAYSFGLGALLYLILDGASLGSMASTSFYAMNSIAFLAIPLYVLAGVLMTMSGIADRLVRFCLALLKNVKGAMGATIVAASAFFGMLTGSNVATITAIAGIMKGPMTKMGYKKEYIAAIVAAAGPLGYMIPPNTNAIMYAVIASCSVSSLFLSTIIPGAIWAALMILANRFLFPRYFSVADAAEGYEETALRESGAFPTAAAGAVSRVGAGGIGATAADTVEEIILPARGTVGTYFGELWKTFFKTVPALIMPLIIFGGIYSGMFTATEAGAVSALYAIILGLFILKSMKTKDIWGSFTSTGRQMGTILFIVPFSAMFTYVLITNGAPQAIAHFLLGLSDSRIIMLLLIDLIYVISGFFEGPSVLIFVVTPLIMPTAFALGIDPIQLGVILFVAIGIGNITPPMAYNLFIAAKVVDADVTKVIPPLYYYFFIAGVPTLFLVTFVPELSLWLPRLVNG